MIPILYEASERAFNTNGIGRLIDCTSCIVTEQRNGIYEVQLDYPVSGKWYQEMADGRIIFCTHDDSRIPQPFRIYRRSTPIDGMVTFNARHISYDLNNVILQPFTATSVADAFAQINGKSINTNGFIFWTDKATAADFALNSPASVRSALGGVRGSILDIYGGEYEFDKFTVKLHADRGTDSGVTLRYGKNIVDFQQTLDNGSTYDAVVPYWYQDGTLVTVDGYIVRNDSGANKLVALDLTSEFDEAPTKAQLQSKAQSYLASNKPWVPAENIKIDFVALWQTDEYKDVAILQRVKLCDMVNVYIPPLNITINNMKVVKVIYNVLADRYDEIELGEPRSTFSQTLSRQIYDEIAESTKNLVNKSMLQGAIDYATELIAGGLGGHIAINRNADGEPEELLIMDTDDTSTAVNVWRWNLNGLGHSHSGYNGPFDDVAITMDGRINANMITAGYISANIIQGGVLNLGGPDNGNGSIKVYDGSGNQIGSWDKDGASMTGDLVIQKTMDTYYHNTMMFTEVNYRWLNSTYTRSGLAIRRQYGSRAYYGELTFTPGDERNTNSYTHNAMNFICSNRDLSISAQNAFMSSTRESEIRIGTFEIYMSSGNSDTSTSGRSTLTITKGHIGMMAGYFDMPGDVRAILSNTTTNAANVNNSGGKLNLVSSSSKRYKRDISEEIPEDLSPDKLYDLKIKTYIYRDEYLSKDDHNYGKRIIGFIAEDVDEIFPIGCQYDEDNRPEMWNSNIMIPSMLKLIQDQKKKIDDLETRISRLEKLI